MRGAHFGYGQSVRLLTFAVLSLGAVVAAAAPAKASFSTLYSFCPNFDCSTGAGPRGSLLADAHGNLYGVAYYGGANGQGVAYVLRRDGQNWTYQVIHDFCAGRRCADGAVPSTPLFADTSGNLYGATQAGGQHKGGVFFRLAPPAGGIGAWKEAVLYDFCTLANCADGSQPLFRLAYPGAAASSPYDGHSPIYGIAVAGGSDNGGALYALTPGEAGWVNTTLYSFCAASNCPEGSGPSGGPVLAASGALYGVTYYGGAANYGVIYRFSRSSYKVLHDFCDGCAEGGSPDGTLALDAAGNLYGAAKYGGACSGECGTVFRFAPGSRQYAVLHNFCTTRHCRDGNEPYGDLLLDAAGNLYGTTRSGGKLCDGYAGAGIAYRLSASEFSIRHSFCGGGDGLFPTPGLSFGKYGKLYGTTAGGGGSDETIYQVSP